MPPLSQQFDRFMEKNDPYWSGKENYRIQQEYIKMLKEDPIIHFPMMLTIPSNSPDIVAIDI